MVDAMVIGGALGGLLIGFILGRQTAPGRGEARELEKKLQEAQDEQNRMNTAVREHFVTTADKLNRLTDQYRDVHQHMAAGAAALCGDTAANFAALEAPRDIEGELDAGVPESTENTNFEGEEAAALAAATATAAPPRDYAPKASPEDPGVLNERFGLDEARSDGGADGGPPPPEDDITADATDGATGADQPGGTARKGA